MSTKQTNKALVMSATLANPSNTVANTSSRMKIRRKHQQQYKTGTQLQCPQLHLLGCSLFCLGLVLHVSTLTFSAFFNLTDSLAVIPGGISSLAAVPAHVPLPGSVVLPLALAALFLSPPPVPLFSSRLPSPSWTTGMSSLPLMFGVTWTPLISWSLAFPLFIYSIFLPLYVTLSCFSPFPVHIRLRSLSPFVPLASVSLSSHHGDFALNLFHTVLGIHLQAPPVNKRREHTLPCTPFLLTERLLQATAGPVTARQPVCNRFGAQGSRPFTERT